MKSVIFALLSLLGTFAIAAQAERPNILVIMVDDLCFSDIGCYGGEIETPNLDRLARNGLRFSQFYNTAKCHSSRICLLTGRYAYQAGNLDLSQATTSAEGLGQAGYFTAMTGKWHLKQQPTDFGFHRYFGHLSGACNYYKGDKTFRLNGEPWKVPDTGFYTTVANVDYALKFLEEARPTKKPWYLYVAFNAPHAPLQPLKEDYEKYAGHFDQGWDVTRDARLAKQRELGLFGRDFKPSPRPDHISAWQDLSPERRKWESQRMTALAGMIDRVDQELGRLFADLQKAGEMENTFILFVSDNGACPYDRGEPAPDRMPYEPNVRWGDSTGWAWARNAPLRYYKQNQFEGGICTPAIVHWPKGLKRQKGSITDQPAHLAEIAGVEIPNSWPERELEPLAGISLLPHLQGSDSTDRPPIHFLFGSDRGLRNGDWKLVSFRSQPWELYNIPADRTELNNIAAKHPDRVRRMVDQWHEMTAKVLKAPKKSNTPVAAESSPHQHPEWTAFNRPLGEIARAGRKPKRVGTDRKPSRSLGIRARKGTKMKINYHQLHLEFTGDDGGIAIDQIKGIGSPGPYRLTLRLKAAGAGGEVFFKTESGRTLPQSPRIEFKIGASDQWQDIRLELATDKTILGLRLDTCDRPGTAVIADLTLRNSAGKKLRSWPE